MTLAELYIQVNGNLEELFNRFGTETRVKRFLGLFLKDPSFNELKAAVDAGDWNTAFRAAHTLKGVTANMCLARLQKSASDLTEALRNGAALQNRSLFDAVCEDFTFTVQAVQEYLASNP